MTLRAPVLAVAPKRIVGVQDLLESEMVRASVALDLIDNSRGTETRRELHGYRRNGHDDRRE